MEFVSLARSRDFSVQLFSHPFFTMGPSEEARFSFVLFFVRGPKLWLEKRNSCGVLHLLPFYSKFMGKCAVDLNSRFWTTKRVSCFDLLFFRGNVSIEVFQPNPLIILQTTGRWVILTKLSNYEQTTTLALPKSPSYPKFARLNTKSLIFPKHLLYVTPSLSLEEVLPSSSFCLQLSQSPISESHPRVCKIKQPDQPFPGILGDIPPPHPKQRISDESVKRITRQKEPLLLSTY